MTFRELMETFKLNDDLCNEAVYQDLLVQIKTNRITPVIGAGLSVWAGYPLWYNLLLQKAVGTYVEDIVRVLLDKEQYEQAASKLEEFYQKNSFLQAIKTAFSPQRIHEEERPGYQRLLPKLFPGPIVTTNFDVSLERLFDLSFALTPKNEIHMPELYLRLQRNERVLVKLHGTIDDATNMVLTCEQYNRVYGYDPVSPDMSCPLPKALSAIFHVAPPLFLGCGLGVDRTCAVLRACTGTTGFALLELPKETENMVDPYHPILEQKSFLPSFEKRRAHLDSMGLRIIWYPHKQHDAVRAFITQLSEDVDHTSKSSSIHLEDRYARLKMSLVSAVQNKTNLEEEWFNQARELWETTKDDRFGVLLLFAYCEIKPNRAKGQYCYDTLKKSNSSIAKEALCNAKIQRYLNR